MERETKKKKIMKKTKRKEGKRDEKRKTCDLIGE